MCRSVRIAVVVGVLIFLVSAPSVFAQQGQGYMVSLSASPLTTFQLDNSGNPTPAQTLTITATYYGNGGILNYCVWWGGCSDTMTVCVGVAGGTAWAMTGSSPSNTDTIPASAVQIMPNGGSWGSIAGSGSHCGITPSTQIWQGSVSIPTGNGNAQQTSSFQVRLNGYSPNLQADTYTGTITIYAGFY